MGAFSSSAVVLLKARPIINVTTSLEVNDHYHYPAPLILYDYLVHIENNSNAAQDSMLRRIDPGKAGCLKDPNSPHACFHFSACFTVEEDQVGIFLMEL